MPRPGRPRANLARKILADWSEQERCIAQSLSFVTSSWRIAYEVACLRLTLEKGTALAIARCAPLIEKLRRTKWALANDPRRELPDREFLERLIEAHTPGFDWRQDALRGEEEDQEYDQENERLAQERAPDVRWKKAYATKFYTPDLPDAVWLFALAWERRKQQRFVRRSWPTLRELKLATAIPERTLKKIIKSLRPKRGEIIRESLRRKLVGRGAMPLRYGPRLIIGVLNEFLKRLHEFPLDDWERKHVRKTALGVMRAFVAKLGHSR